MCYIMSRFDWTRELDPSEPMPIFKDDELSDLDLQKQPMDGIVTIPSSGLLKEEEKDAHLQSAISTGSVIPTPEVEVINSEIYDRLYPTNYKTPRQLIREEQFEQDIPDYDIDSSDEDWLNTNANKIDITPLKFEEIMGRLESNAHINQNEAKSLFKKDGDDLIVGLIYDYWLEKRMKNQQPLVPKVGTEACLVGKSNNDPYLVSSRRDKMNNDSKKKYHESYQKMVRLGREMSSALQLLDLIRERETVKKRSLELDIETYEKRYQFCDQLEGVSPVKVPRLALAPIHTNQLVDQSIKDFGSVNEKVKCQGEKMDSVDECVDSHAAIVQVVQIKDASAISALPLVHATPSVFHSATSDLTADGALLATQAPPTEGLAEPSTQQANNPAANGALALGRNSPQQHETSPPNSQASSTDSDSVAVRAA